MFGPNVKTHSGVTLLGPLVSIGLSHLITIKLQVAAWDHRQDSVWIAEVNRLHTLGGHT